MEKGMLTLSKWGNSLSVRIPKKILETFQLSNQDKLTYSVEKDQIVLKPVKKESPFRKMFDGFDTKAYFADEPTNKEDDWQSPQGKEDF
ncbi:MAG: AbrB/MazE/SpoVT family DNA-binding domain-containing protein [[Lactobacillus] timonensis]|jgi:antitoxin MazE|uniref:AbrB/MazE/SpoVT family DNA-binding domain-containing protein n=1 Tax=[Lactobacillus] timonensis TaxID=1970790 RepID=UPI002357CA3C|nr:AbrB/MazE/SpoVT family DNA-binding domain-containing protein [[Lactobacillus] timonensis]MCI1925425.1 AbrB/MazE/SpoVT family DNA-binding domain-containing protein [[Lactobacillus] timonensis]MCI1956823.1 AbrB/MazE/SpoVT family DNA-binding domain-containing protein [[Lactobacillus] timonensis]MCI1969813.1 AbrB/MazE/SpoVT family DNA-binding domain-containing protein [[Lactobacillus] timonensis]MCI2005974.1 AbrB/MazE/SpoVT family DNA-binding domain-containing protein [[Lactobacillus] timonensis